MLRTRTWVAVALTACTLPLLPSAVRASTSAPSLTVSDEQAVVSYVNTYFRHPMGLPALTVSPALGQTAQNHANYLVAHPNQLGHNETPGSSGFTGATPSDRCIAAGVAAGCAEVVYAGLDLGDSVRGWLGGPIHGPILLEACSIGFGYSAPHAIAAMVGDARYDSCQPSGTAGRAPNTSGAALHVWPANGTTGVWPVWSERETPNPLAGSPFKSSNVGFPIYVMNTGATDETVNVSLTGPSGAVPLFQPNKAASAATTTVHIAAATPNGPTTLALMPATRLAYGSTYKLSVTPSAGAALHATFHTVGQSVDPKLTLTNVKATKAGSLWHLSATVNLSVPFRPDADYDGVNGLSRSGVKVGVVPVLGRTHQLFVTVKYKAAGGPFSTLDTAHPQALKGSFSVTLPALVVPGTVLLSAHVPTWDGHADEHYNAKNIQARISAK
ncbi:MAG TPA: CAP domain-containing protein [Gaiellaceae bacterium]